jgi:hypothetical protein
MDFYSTTHAYASREELFFASLLDLIILCFFASLLDLIQPTNEKYLYCLHVLFFA